MHGNSNIKKNVVFVGHRVLTTQFTERNSTVGNHGEKRSSQHLWLLL